MSCTSLSLRPLHCQATYTNLVDQYLSSDWKDATRSVGLVVVPATLGEYNATAFTDRQVLATQRALDEVTGV